MKSLDQTNHSPASPELPRSLLLLGFYLVLITALARLGTSLYLPALPRMGSALRISPHQLSFTMTAYLATFALASIFFGPVSDHWGRQRMTQAGIGAFLAGSLCCALAQGYGLLIAGRILQAAGGSAVQVNSRAMTRDAFNDQQMIGILGWMGTVTGLVPVLAPVLGGFLTQACGWRSNFYLLTAVTLLVMVTSKRLARETLPPEKRTPFHVAGILQAYATMLLSPGFIAPVIPVMLCFALQGAYLVASPFIFIRVLDMQPALFGLTSLLLVGALLAGRFTCLAIVKRRTDYIAFMTGCLLTFLGGILSLAIIRFHWISAPAILISSALFCLGFGTLLPIGMKAGLSAFPKRVGVSSALYGCLTLGATAAGSAVAGALLEQTARDINVLCLLTFTVGCAILLSALPCRRSVSEARKTT